MAMANNLYGFVIKLKIEQFYQDMYMYRYVYIPFVLCTLTLNIVIKVQVPYYRDGVWGSEREREISTSTLSQSPFLNPVLRFVTITELTVAACPPE